MNHERMGPFIAELRKSHHMTQKDLAAKLNITDKAVSKWERGLSCPDISLLPGIADILGVTTGELLNGEKSVPGQKHEEVVSVENALEFADKSARHKVKSVQGICAVIFTLLLVIGLAVCAICNLAMEGTLTWSGIPISSIVFAWLVLFPIVKAGEKGICVSLLSLSMFILPYLWVLNGLIPSAKLLLPIGIPVALIAVAFLWSVFGVFRVLRKRMFLALAMSMLLSLLVCLLVNVCLSTVISEPIFDWWDALDFLIIGVTAVIFFLVDNYRKKKRF